MQDEMYVRLESIAHGGFSTFGFETVTLNFKLPLDLALLWRCSHCILTILRDAWQICRVSATYTQTKGGLHLDKKAACPSPAQRWQRPPR